MSSRYAGSDGRRVQSVSIRQFDYRPEALPCVYADSRLAVCVPCRIHNFGTLLLQFFSGFAQVLPAGFPLLLRKVPPSFKSHLRAHLLAGKGKFQGSSFEPQFPVLRLTHPFESLVRFSRPKRFRDKPSVDTVDLCGFADTFVIPYGLPILVYGNDRYFR